MYNTNQSIEKEEWQESPSNGSRFCRAYNSKSGAVILLTKKAIYSKFTDTTTHLLLAIALPLQFIMYTHKTLSIPLSRYPATISIVNLYTFAKRCPPSFSCFLVLTSGTQSLLQTYMNEAAGRDSV